MPVTLDAHGILHAITLLRYDHTHTHTHTETLSNCLTMSIKTFGPRFVKIISFCLNFKYTYLRLEATIYSSLWMLVLIELLLLET